MDTAVRRMGQDEFLNWLEDQERKHELIDGVPYMMTGSTGGMIAFRSTCWG